MLNQKLEPRSSLNIISLNVFYATGVPWENIMKQLIEVSSFGGERIHTLGFVNLDLTAGPIGATHRFHIINPHKSYNLLLEHTWIHCHKAIPSTYAWKQSGKEAGAYQLCRTIPKKLSAFLRGTLFWWLSWRRQCCNSSTSRDSTTGLGRFWR